MLSKRNLDKLHRPTAVSCAQRWRAERDFALLHADSGYVLEHARIVWEGEPASFAAEPGMGICKSGRPPLPLFRILSFRRSHR